MNENVNNVNIDPVNIEVNIDLAAADLNEIIRQRLENRKEQLLKPQRRLLGCMDEGVKGKSVGLGGGGLVFAYLAGKKKGKSGWDAVIAGIDSAAGMFKGLLDGVSSHAGCGASGIIHDNLIPEDRKRFVHADDPGELFARKLAARLNLPCCHIENQQMGRPPENHTARMVFYTGTLHFALNDELPTGMAFTVNRGILERQEDHDLAAETGRTLLETACRIAVGPHGPTEPISPESPFFIVPVGGDLVPLETSRQEAHEAAAKFPGLVKVLDGFTL